MNKILFKGNFEEKEKWLQANSTNIDDIEQYVDVCKPCYADPSSGVLECYYTGGCQYCEATYIVEQKFVEQK